MMQFSLLTPEGELFSAQVDQVDAQGAEGDLGVLPDHVAFVTPLKVAPLSIKSDGQESRFAVYGGILQVTPEEVTVLADQADLPEQLDRRAVLSQQERLETQLSQTQHAEQEATLKHQLQIVQTQLEVLA